MPTEWLLTADSDEYQYFESAIDYWEYQNFTDHELTGRGGNFEILQHIMQQEVKRNEHQQVICAYWECATQCG